MPENKTAEDILNIANRQFLSQERVNAEQQWKELADYLHPISSGMFNAGGAGQMSPSTSPGAKKTTRIYESRSIRVCQDLASAFHSTLTNPATKWSKIRFIDETLNNLPGSVSWAQEASSTFHRALGESNFDTEISRAYLDYVVFGNMILLQESDDEDGGLRFKAVNIAQVCWMEDQKGRVDTVFRKFKYTAKQAVQRWGENAGKNVLKALDKDPSKEFIFLHAVMPRDKSLVKTNDAGLSAPNKRKFGSYYINTEDKEIVESGGYYENPYLVVRFDLRSDEVYGTGPGHIALPDIKSLNCLRKNTLAMADLVGNPAVLISRRDQVKSIKPGARLVVEDIDRSVRYLQPDVRVGTPTVTEEDLRNSIKEIFFLDKLLLPPRTEVGEMTATEVVQRTEQMQRVLGPVLSRLNSELLKPLVERGFRILLRQGVLPELPAELVGRNVDVDISFVNQMARSQQIEDVTNIQGWAQELAMLAQLKPEVLDIINADGAAKHSAKVRNIPEVAIENDNQVKQIRQQRSQQVQQQSAIDQAVSVADIQSKTRK